MFPSIPTVHTPLIFPTTNGIFLDAGSPFGSMIANRSARTANVDPVDSSRASPTPATFPLTSILTVHSAPRVPSAGASLVPVLNCPAQSFCSMVAIRESLGDAWTRSERTAWTFPRASSVADMRVSMPAHAVLSAS